MQGFFNSEMSVLFAKDTIKFKTNKRTIMNRSDRSNCLKHVSHFYKASQKIPVTLQMLVELNLRLSCRSLHQPQLCDGMWIPHLTETCCCSTLTEM